MSFSGSRENVHLYGPNMHSGTIVHIYKTYEKSLTKVLLKRRYLFKVAANHLIVGQRQSHFFDRRIAFQICL